MKTAEDWNKFWIGDEANPQSSLVNLIKAIQLDAYKAGMTEAAEIVSQHPHTATIQGAILSARDKKETL